MQSGLTSLLMNSLTLGSMMTADSLDFNWGWNDVPLLSLAPEHVLLQHFQPFNISLQHLQPISCPCVYIVELHVHGFIMFQDLFYSSV